MSARPPEHDAIVLAGGAARRLGGLDKPGLYVGSSTLLSRVLSAVPAAARVVVVGPPRPVTRDVTWAREDPIGSGPVAALAAGLAAVTAPRVVLLAGDLPFLTAAAVEELLLTQGNALAVDRPGRDQYLCSAWDTASLRSLDLSVRRLRDVVAQLPTTRVRLAVVPGVPAPWTDCDTPEDLEAAREAG